MFEEKTEPVEFRQVRHSHGVRKDPTPQEDPGTRWIEWDEQSQTFRECEI